MFEIDLLTHLFVKGKRHERSEKNAIAIRYSRTSLRSHNIKSNDKFSSPGGHSPCYENPCEGNGTCEEHDGTFTCFCTSDRTGNRCERTLDVGGIQVDVLFWFDFTISLESFLFRHPNSNESFGYRKQTNSQILKP